MKDLVALKTNYVEMNGSPFKVLPESGFVEPGATAVFRIVFSPLEVDDFSAKLVCQIPYLAQEQSPPIVNITGFSRRPLCHFDVTMSDYISAGRRHPDYTYPLPDGIKVMEIFSGKVGLRNIKKFAIINATNEPYETRWINISDNSNGAIACITPQALISSGKKYQMSFSYTPASVKTVESLWEFQIPAHQISVKLLVVGRIMPH